MYINWTEFNIYIYVRVPFKSSPTFSRGKVGEIVRLLSPYGTRHGAIPCTDPEESFETSDTRYGDRDARRRFVARRFSLPMHARFLVYFISTDYRHTACIIARVRLRLKPNTLKTNHERNPHPRGNGCLAKRKSTFPPIIDNSASYSILCDDNEGSRTNFRTSFKK